LWTFSGELARTQLSAQESDIEIGNYRYRAEFETGSGFVRENGPEGEKEYRIEHVRVFREAPEGHIPEDTKIINLGTFSNEQINAICASCHAKMTSITTTFLPGDKYFDHFTLAAFEEKILR